MSECVWVWVYVRVDGYLNVCHRPCAKVVGGKIKKKSQLLLVATAVL